jgi:hypothetical protein
MDHTYYVNSATCFDVLGHFHEIKINEILYHVCRFSLYDFINLEYIAKIYNNIAGTYIRMIHEWWMQDATKASRRIFKKIDNIIERLRKITNKLRTASHNCEIERQVVNRHKQHSLLNEYQLDCNLYTKQRNFYILNFRGSRQYFSLHYAMKNK